MLIISAETAPIAAVPIEPGACMESVAFKLIADWRGISLPTPLAGPACAEFAPVERTARALCRVCPARAPPGATGRRRGAKNAPSERFAQKN